MHCISQVNTEKLTNKWERGRHHSHAAPAVDISIHFVSGKLHVAQQSPRFLQLRRFTFFNIILHPVITDFEDWISYLRGFFKFRPYGFLALRTGYNRPRCAMCSLWQQHVSLKSAIFFHLSLRCFCGFGTVCGTLAVTNAVNCVSSDQQHFAGCHSVWLNFLLPFSANEIIEFPFSTNQHLDFFFLWLVSKVANCAKCVEAPKTHPPEFIGTAEGGTRTSAVVTASFRTHTRASVRPSQHRAFQHQPDRQT